MDTERKHPVTGEECRDYDYAGDCKHMTNQPTLKTIIGEELEKLEEYGELHSRDCKVNFPERPDSEAGICNCRMKGMKKLLASSIRSAIKKAFEATAVEKEEYVSGDPFEPRNMEVQGWNKALAEKRQKETGFLEP